MKKLRVFLPVFFSLLILPILSFSAADELTAPLKHSIDSALVILNNQALMGPAHSAERRAKVRAVIKKTIDFEEMTKRSLGIHWRGRTEEERREFVGLFSALLESAYIDKIEANYDARVTYSGGKINKKRTRGIVRTRVLTRKGRSVPINYRMMKKKRGWVAYDVVIEGVSLVSNYRTQFNQIILKSSYGGLVKNLRKKLKDRKPLVVKRHHK